MIPDSEGECQYLADREDRRTVESKRRAADHVLHPYLLAATENVGLIMYQYRQELHTSTRTPSIQDIRDNELGIPLLQFVRDCCTLVSKRHSDDNQRPPSIGMERAPEGQSTIQYSKDRPRCKLCYAPTHPGAIRGIETKALSV
jgi:hypothetical protein